MRERARATEREGDCERERERESGEGIGSQSRFLYGVLKRQPLPQNSFPPRFTREWMFQFLEAVLYMYVVSTCLCMLCSRCFVRVTRLLLRTAVLIEVTCWVRSGL